MQRLRWLLLCATSACVTPLSTGTGAAPPRASTGSAEAAGTIAADSGAPSAPAGTAGEVDPAYVGSYRSFVVHGGGFSVEDPYTQLTVLELRADGSAQIVAASCDGATVLMSDCHAARTRTEARWAMRDEHHLSLATREGERVARIYAGQLAFEDEVYTRDAGEKDLTLTGITPGPRKDALRLRAAVADVTLRPPAGWSREGADEPELHHREFAQTPVEIEVSFQPGLAERSIAELGWLAVDDDPAIWRGEPVMFEGGRSGDLRFVVFVLFTEDSHELTVVAERQGVLVELRAEASQAQTEALVDAMVHIAATTEVSVPARNEDLEQRLVGCWTDQAVIASGRDHTWDHERTYAGGQSRYEFFENLGFSRRTYVMVMAADTSYDNERYTTGAFRVYDDTLVLFGSSIETESVAFKGEGRLELDGQPLVPCE